jgi:hypothetical protein
MIARFTSLLTLGAVLLGASSASAQMDEDLIPPEYSFECPEGFALEARVGPYHPDLGDSFDSFFSGDDGPLLAMELDVIGYRLDDVLYVGGGGGIGWMNFTGKTRDMAGAQTSEDTSFEVVPLNLVAVLRVDVLARQLGIPFLFAGKLGYQWAHWSAESGGQDDASGWSLGLVYGAQIALDLDTFEPSAARRMDEEWGINHSFLFLELFGFEPGGDSLDIGDLTWTAGLGFIL